MKQRRMEIASSRWGRMREPNGRDPALAVPDSPLASALLHTNTASNAVNQCTNSSLIVI